jgi:hypothetical protein
VQGRLHCLGDEPDDAVRGLLLLLLDEEGGAKTVPLRVAGVDVRYPELRQEAADLAARQAGRRVGQHLADRLNDGRRPHLQQRLGHVAECDSLFCGPCRRSALAEAISAEPATKRQATHASAADRARGREKMVREVESTDEYGRAPWRCR